MNLLLQRRVISCKYIFSSGAKAFLINPTASKIFIPGQEARKPAGSWHTFNFQKPVCQAKAFDHALVERFLIYGLTLTQ